VKKFSGILCALLLGLLTAGVAGAATFTYPGTPVAIPEGDYLYADIVVTDSGTVTDVNVCVDVTHTCISDLDIYLAHWESESSTGKYVQLFNEYGGAEDNLTGVTFDDEAATYIDSGTPPYGPGSFKPVSTFDSYTDSNLLSSFDGNSIAGTWSLVIWDNYTEDTGTLNAFSFTTNGETPPCNAVPIPGAFWLLGSGIIGLVGISRKSSS